MGRIRGHLLIGIQGLTLVEEVEEDEIRDVYNYGEYIPKLGYIYFNIILVSGLTTAFAALFLYGM